MAIHATICGSRCSILQTNFDYVLVVATGLDAGGNIVILAWGMLPRETTDNWKWFLEHLKEALDCLDEEDCVIISDRQKVSQTCNLCRACVFPALSRTDCSQGLVNAIQHVLPSATEAFCTQHIKANIEKEFGREAGKLYANCVRKGTRQEYGRALKAFSKLSDGPKIRAYIRKIPTRLWATHAFPQRRWGYTISNIVEIINGVLSSSGTRQLPPLKLLHHIWEYQQRLFAERAIQAKKTEGMLCAQATAYLNQTLHGARSWDVIPARADDNEMKATIRSQKRLCQWPAERAHCPGLSAYWRDAMHLPTPR